MKTILYCITMAVIIAFSHLHVKAKEIQGFSKQTIINNNPDARTVLANCAPATAQVDLDINNVRAKLLNGGDMWWDIFGNQSDAYQVPKLPKNVIGPNSQFASSIWVGGYDAGGQLKSAAQTYRQTGNDYWPGPLTNNAFTNVATCLAWDRFWKLNRKDVADYYAWVVSGSIGDNPILNREGDPMEAMTSWPAFGTDGQPIAPFYDSNGDGIYDPSIGDVPDFDITGEKGCDAQLYGDQSIFWVFNDKGNVHTEAGCPAIGLEIQAQAFAYATNDELNNATFLKYKIINKSSFRLDSTFFGIWDDADLGYYLDDFVGCDVGLGMGILYNGTEVDGSGQATAYGANPPAIGVDFFEGPYANPNGIDDAPLQKPPSYLNYGDGIVDNERLGMSKFRYYNGTSAPDNGNPNPGDDYYQYLCGVWRNGQPMTYGGDGIHGSNIPCSYMFPGTSDLQYFYGTNGVPVPGWSEESIGNQPNDRRFLISSGPFTMQAGAVNTITIGVPWARATQGGPLASVALLKGADLKLQELFNNCFALLDGPDAPLLSIQELNNELVLYWNNPFTSNNYQEKYKADYDAASALDSMYRFQGYQIFQLKDASVGANDLYNPDKARLVFQCDKKDEVNQIVNYYNDASISAVVPQEMVNGENKGIVHSISVTTDKFANGTSNLVNFKKYYYTIVAYAYSRTQVPSNLNVLKDYLPYVSGRRNAGSFVNIGIPHKPSPEASGTVQQTTYGSGPKLTRIEGQGNGNNVLDFTNETIDAILGAADSRSINPTYTNGKGPVAIKVIDPLSVPEDTKFRFIIYPKPSATAITINSTWDLIKMSKNCNCSDDTVHSENNIKLPFEQLINGQESGLPTVLIPKWGLSVNAMFAYDPGNATAVNGSFLEATIEFADPYKPWLTGVKDVDGTTPLNWIRSGRYEDMDGIWQDYLNKDDEQAYEKVLDGTWAPYRLCAYTVYPITSPNPYLGGPAWNNSVAMAMNVLKNTASVDVVFTNDKSKWTRCAVIEMQEEPANAIGNAKKCMLRKSPSVDKEGNLAAIGSGSSGNPNDANYIGENGMGWFPGYAINLETGELLNMAFGEDSWLASENGADMKWNPTSTQLSALSNNPLFGGKHYIYVFGHNGDKLFASTDSQLPNELKDVPRYDAGRMIYTLLNKAATLGTTGDNYTREVYADAMWVNIPLLKQGKQLLETDAKVRLRVAKSYQKGYTTTAAPVLDLASNAINNNFAVYDFDTKDIGAIKFNTNAAKDALALINVVPNPYYAYSSYETTSSDNTVKITNVPERCTVAIYTLNGTLVRTFNKSDAATYMDWDLRNNAKNKIASGMYLIHVSVPDIGTRTLKWFAVMRQNDLEAE
jgi:hypothetical protein